MRVRRHPFALAAALGLAALGLAAPRSASAAEPAACSGTLSGAVKASFTCAVVMRDLPDGTVVVEISLTQKLEDLASFGVGAWIIPGKPAKGRYGFNDLGPGKSSLVLDKKGVLYTASRTTRGRGDASFEFTSVEPRGAPAGTYAVHGIYRARLIPLASELKDEVTVEARF